MLKAFLQKEEKWFQEDTCNIINEVTALEKMLELITQFHTISTRKYKRTLSIHLKRPIISWYQNYTGSTNTNNIPHENRYKNPQKQQTESSIKYYTLNLATYKNPRSKRS